MKIRYNAPVTLTFTLAAVIVLVIDQITAGAVTRGVFSVPGRGGFSFGAILDWPRLVLHPLGHAGWDHLIANFAFILLLGPNLEERHGSGSLLFMIFVTALVTGVLNVLFLPAGLYGASGIVFMMIVLSSFTNFRRGELPVTFILVVILYVAREVVNALQENTVSEFAHILGGVLGSLFGLFRPPRQGKPTAGGAEGVDSTPL